jgi:hypothetical protein
MLARTAKNLWLDLIIAIALVAGVGLTAIGASGIVAAGMGTWLGAQFVAGDSPDRTYTPERCADFAEYHPEASDCRAAAAMHHFDEVVEYRLAVGILGLLALGTVLGVRRRFAWLADHGALPPSFSATVGAALFGMAALVLLGPGLLDLVFGPPDGAGQLLSGGLVSLIVFVGYTTVLFRTLLGRQA